MILNIQEQHISQVAKLHQENLPSFLSEYPLSFIEKFYHQQLKRNKQLLLGDFEDGELRGFVFGTDHVENLYKDFITDHQFYFYFQTICTLFFNPKYILLFASKFVSKKYVSRCKRQLVYIAVDAHAGKKGVGTSLLKALEEEWKDMKYYELEVEANNKAFCFYKKNGFFLVHEYNNWIEKKYLLGKNLL